MTGAETLREKATGVLALLILGLGFVAMFSEFEQFYVVWILGFAVVLPIVAILLGDSDDEDEPAREPEREPAPASDTDRALADLRERYARGEMDDETFETRLERLLETESVGRANEYLSRRDDRGRARERE